ncbi:thiazolylpeptide-type bacteriocin (plasmid) [Streptococcus salivarius]|uniref:Thiazolylpeptide-type bacteriocin n=1 Tax=Streptococcus salivarius TaxID=1304 RepID=A0A7L6WPB2_STRSL|nr:thiazolylpeptide-type bacteriocin [Streptococcus salivarius]QMI52042.1 thiazolylpeptide-type bacteriocin [Streptococcus salivarius]
MKDEKNLLEELEIDILELDDEGIPATAASSGSGGSSTCGSTSCSSCSSSCA